MLPAQLLICLAEALRSLHRRGLTHGALMPATVQLQITQPQPPAPRSPPGQQEQPQPQAQHELAVATRSEDGAAPPAAAIVALGEAAGGAGAAASGPDPDADSWEAHVLLAPLGSALQSAAPADGSEAGEADPTFYTGASQLPALARSLSQPPQQQRGEVQVQSWAAVGAGQGAGRGQRQGQALPAEVEAAPRSLCQPAAPRSLCQPAAPEQAGAGTGAGAPVVPPGGALLAAADEAGKGAGASQLPTPRQEPAPRGGAGAGAGASAAAARAGRAARALAAAPAGCVRAVLPLPAVSPAVLQLQTWGRARPVVLPREHLLWSAPELLSAPCSLGWALPGLGGGGGGAQVDPLDQSLGLRSHQHRRNGGGGGGAGRQQQQQRGGQHGDGGSGGGSGGGGGSGRRFKGNFLLGLADTVSAHGIAPNCDVYALGLMMWHLVSGRQPLHHLTTQEVLRAKELPSLDDHLPFSAELPMSYIHLARSCWATAPAHRPPVQSGGRPWAAAARRPSGGALASPPPAAGGAAAAARCGQPTGSSGVGTAASGSSDSSGLVGGGGGALPVTVAS
ncbi:hypothetical protein TSOC_011030 [Tetrabaena socialis]|uniref:Serine-threonine/tyrosine-protein kinase catalytic domain-containing protein n=1 Tax=Tetrabaena socialis TaxID=47790 RepID=A0A2J7ZRR6_9CHLO|nr:hypothetical protein TSOC_011030 [Tetrabaena socialis]|eukprot:PNH02948.1 hypothetical protein TSOC_011030 [Tetrabaena socialis]